MNEYVTSLMAEVKAKNPAEPEFHQAVQEVAESLALVLDRHPEYKHAKILERIIEPERVILFRVPWVDDQGQVRVNRGFRIEMNSAIGPYKGGLRFHPSVNLGILKFLAFEQVFKNSLTTLPMGGGKGGTDFDPKGKSDNEVMRFCQAFMSELFRHIGPDTDVPGRRHRRGRPRDRLPVRHVQEAAQRVHRRPHRQGPQLGRLAHPARGHRLRLRVLRAGDARDAQGDALQGKTCLVSGSGNVSQYTVEKILDLGGKVVTFSDSSGYVYDEAGIDREKLKFVMDLKNVRRGRIKEYSDKFKTAVYTPIDPKLDYNPLWNHKAQCAFPSATQNEINGKDAENLLKNGVYVVGEGANMPSTIDAVNRFLDAKILYGPGKAANAGGVATSGLEMSQNSMRLSWSREEVDTAPPRHHEEHPQGLLRDRRAVRHPGQLRQRRQHRGLPEGRQRDDGPGRRLAPTRAPTRAELASDLSRRLHPGERSSPGCLHLLLFLPSRRL